ncbi:MAG: transposase [Sphaerochaeta sp.]|uniref:transposase n=1 Tax=Sphaerochaeta sp. TaxID=1972642 RepID=UPI003D10B281
MANKFIRYEQKNGAEYASVCLPMRVDGRKVNETENLGRVLDKQRGIFKNRERGVFRYTLEAGYEEAPPDGHALALKPKGPERLILDFGDVHVLDEYLRTTPYHAILNSLLPGQGDTLLALVYHRILATGARCYAGTWYEGSYARLLLPCAALQSQRISEFLSHLGDEELQRRFFRMYLARQFPAETVHGLLIDSTGLPDSIDFPYTAYSNHGGQVSVGTRLIYVTDRLSGMPLYFRYVAGNVIDVSTLKATIEELQMCGIAADYAILDAGYFTEGNIKALHENGIAYLTRLKPNRKLYKQLLAAHAQGLQHGRNPVSYNGRAVYLKRVPCSVGFGIDAFAYIGIDMLRRSHEMNAMLVNAAEDGIDPQEIDNSLAVLGSFIMISSEEIDTKEVLPLYYARQQIEQVFNITKNYADILPLRVHGEDTFRGHLLLCFIATIICKRLQGELDSKGVNLIGLFKELRNQKCKVYDSLVVVQEATKKVNDAYKALKLKSPDKIVR